MGLTDRGENKWARFEVQREDTDLAGLIWRLVKKTQHIN